jgi:hypothetical protein
MIIKDQETTLETIGTIQDESAFKMRSSQKAFQILSSLYSDKPLAIIRELGCNAMDSHIASGQPNRPFHIHAPNALEPWLTIEDYGTGISHENIYDIYAVYFASTKTNTNTQVGMLGLGSKSPFCYTDNFTITSKHLGVKRIYNAYFNAQGMPTISLASQENTNDENGVAIQIPIKSSDFGNFNHAIWKAFRFFDTKPTISGHEVKWDNIKPNFEGSFWKSFHGHSHGECIAIMGGVAYPIDIYKLDNKHYDIARKAGLVIHFNIGELDVTPSRESLMYHDWVIQTLNEKFELVQKDFCSNVEQTIKTSPNLLDALMALYKLKNQWSFLNSSLINGKVFWNKIDISEPRTSIKTYAPNLTSYCKTTWGRKKVSESSYPLFQNNALWYFDDLKKGSLKRINQFVRSNGNSEIAINLVNKSEMNELIKAGFPASTFIPTSTLPSVNTNRAVSGSNNVKPKGVISLYDAGYMYHQSWDSKHFDLTTGTAPKYYVVKSKDGWFAEAGVLKDVNGNPIFTPRTKTQLGDITSFLGINLEKDVKMVAQANAKYLDQLGSKNLADVIGKKKISVDVDKISMSNLIDKSVVQSIVKHKKFQSLSDDNSFKTTILEQNQILEDVKSVESIKKYFKCDDKKSLTFPSKMVSLMYNACRCWQVGADMVIDTLLEQEQNS